MRFLNAPRGRPANRSPLPRNASSRRLTVESLEDRTVPGFLAPFPSPGGGVRLAVGDFDHDGRDDIATVKGTILSSGPFTDVIRAGGSATVHLSAGDGTFRKSAALSSAKGYYLTGFTVSDRNGDGHPDVTLYAFDRRHDPTGVSEPFFRATAYDNVWLGRGDGSFARVSTTAYPHQPTFFNSWPPFAFKQQSAVADFNRDGASDSAAVDGANSVVSISLRNADGAYQPPRNYAAGPSPGPIAVGDFNGDGWADVVVVNNVSSNQPTLSVLLNDGTW
jgi:FG-GAP-like repeat